MLAQVPSPQGLALGALLLMGAALGSAQMLPHVFTCSSRRLRRVALCTSARPWNNSVGGKGNGSSLFGAYGQTALSGQ